VGGWGGGITICVFNVWEVLYLLGAVAAGGFVEVCTVPCSVCMFVLLWCETIVVQLCGIHLAGTNVMWHIEMIVFFNCYWRFVVGLLVCMCVCACVLGEGCAAWWV
jgi:hypothetical protein